MNLTLKHLNNGPMDGGALEVPFDFRWPRPIPAGGDRRE